jgi:ABC-2 type transport system permease protein
MQYKASFIMQVAGHLLVTGIEFFGLWALFHRFGSLPEWSLPEVAFFYGMVNMQFAVADAMARGFYHFGGFVKTGDFDRLLLRPRSSALQLLGHEFTMRRVGRFLQGLVVLIWAVSALHLSWPLWKIPLFLFAFCGGVAFFIGLVIMQATLAFWTVESLEIMNTMTYGGVETAQYPLDIYRKWFQRFFIFVVPLGCVTYLPVTVLIEKTPWGLSPIIAGTAPVTGFLFLVASLLLWRFGIRHYTSTGS